MNKRILRYVGIAAFIALALVLFTNRGGSGHPYRAEVRSLQEETKLSTELFVKGYRTYELEGAYDLAVLKSQIDLFESLVQRYKSLEGLPEKSQEDYAALLDSLEEQQFYFGVIYQVAEKNEPVPGEYALGLKEAVQRRVLYEGLMNRY